MNATQRQAVLKYLEEATTFDTPLSQQQLVSRVNMSLAAANRPLIHERDPDLGMLFRRTQSDLLRELRSRSPSAQTLHDIMFNSCWKVAFESALAAVIYRNRNEVQAEVMSTIRKLKTIVLPAFTAVVSKTGTAADRGLFQCYQKDPNAGHAFHARKNGKIPDTQALTYPLKAQPAKTIIPTDEMLPYLKDRVFNENNYMETFEEKLTAIYNFADFTTRPHKFSEELKGTPEELIELIQFTGSNVSTLLTRMFEDFARYKLNGKPGWFDLKKDGNPSVSRKDRQETQHGLHLSENKSGRFAGIWAVKGKSTLDESNPYLEYVEDLLIPPFYDITGVGLWRPQAMTKDPRDESTKDPFDVASVAMHRLDMPMIGGISGGMGSYLLAMKWVGGNVTRETLTRSFFAAYSVMISKGYHSFHEVAVVAETMNLWYNHGDYASTLKESGLEDLPDMKELLSRFEGLLAANTRTSKRNVIIFDNVRPESSVKLPKGRTGSWEI